MVRLARGMQRVRWEKGDADAPTNSALGTRSLEKVSAMTAQAKSLLDAAHHTIGLSARGSVRVLRVARTIADLDEADRVRETDLAEALSLRFVAEQINNTGR